MLAIAILVVFVVLMLEFGSFAAPTAILFGPILAMFGTILARWVTGTTLNIVSFLGAIIGIGIVAKAASWCSIKSSFIMRGALPSSTRLSRRVGGGYARC